MVGVILQSPMKASSKDGRAGTSAIWPQLLGDAHVQRLETQT